ncbi:CvpA family protein [Brevundimonas sp.]|uniref:CvpA family protein n=1 Tax=Brevundimonas sp. TaxID=1871086 RepID=UPI002D4B8EDD|nr:CvpA family protein [Brevundimonas sp.]HYC69415.1 CvpA family protein [Brevundimonas sp.]
MTWLDYAVLGVLGISIAWGLWRGIVREVVSLAGFVIAFLAANLFAGPLSEHVPSSVVRPELRVLLAFVAIFFLSLILSSLAALLLSKLVKAVGLGALDRGLGALFGVARAALILLAFALLAGLTSLPREAAWRESISGRYLGQGALALKPWLPPALAERLRYD